MQQFFEEPACSGPQADFLRSPTFSPTFSPLHAASTCGLATKRHLFPHTTTGQPASSGAHTSPFLKLFLQFHQMHHTSIPICSIPLLLRNLHALPFVQFFSFFIIDLLFDLFESFAARGKI